MHLHKALDDRQAESESAKGSRRRSVCLPKPLKDKREHFVGDANTVIGYRKPSETIVDRQIDVDRTAIRRELERVVQQILDDL